MSVVWQPGPRNSKPEPVEFYRTADETLWQSGELKEMARDAFLLLAVATLFAAYWWWL